MRRTLAATAAGLLCTALPAFAQDLDKVEIKAQKVGGNVWVLYGAGGNIALSVGDDGVVMVDDQFAPLAPKIRKAIAQITKKPVKFLLNTHWHGDHTGGNVLFQQGGATILAHDNVRKRLAEGNKASGPTHADPAPLAALPVITFDQSATVHLNGEDIRAVHVPRGHTDGDSIVYFTRSNVVHLGDDFFTIGFPFIDLSTGGSVKGTIEALDKLLPTLPKDAKLIPGHGEVSDVEGLRKYTRTLADIYAAVQAGIGQRKTLEQLKKERVLAPWSKLSWAFINEDAFLEIVYADITQNQPSRGP